MFHLPLKIKEYPSSVLDQNTASAAEPIRSRDITPHFYNRMRKSLGESSLGFQSASTAWPSESRHSVKAPLQWRQTLASFLGLN